MEKELLYKFFDGKASKAEKDAIRIWLEKSSENEKEFFKEREFFDAVILSGTLPQTFGIKKTHLAFRRLLREVLKVAAVLVLAIGCGTYLYKAEIRRIGHAMNIITVPAGQRVNLTLPDGTNVWLNARSEMRYPAAFTGGKREVTLDGEAYFEVMHDEAKPFVVQTAKCDVEVLGTKFNVEAYSDSEDFNTALMEGSVKVTNNQYPSNQVLLSPDHIASLKGDRLSTSPIADPDVFRWREGLICFRNMSFEQLMVRFEKCYGIRIIVQNKQLVDYICNGKFRISDGIDNALRILQKDAKYTFERNNDESVIYIK